MYLFIFITYFIIEFTFYILHPNIKVTMQKRFNIIIVLKLLTDTHISLILIAVIQDEHCKLYKY